MAPAPPRPPEHHVQPTSLRGRDARWGGEASQIIGGFADCHTSCVYKGMQMCLRVAARAYLCVFVSVSESVSLHLCR